VPKKIHCTVVKSILLGWAGDLPINEMRDAKHHHNPRPGLGHSAVRKPIDPGALELGHLVRPGGILDYYA
jgi:hypothetical protein